MKIKELVLYTQHLASQIEFYAKTLEFELVHQDKMGCSFKLGNSILSFKLGENIQPYHFAFNIYSNKEHEALNWLKERVELLPFNGKRMVNFQSWNAKALYFYDHDKNIVEYIARKNLKNNSNEPFSSASILNISEIGIASSTLKKTYEKIHIFKPIELYSGNFNRFCALGNEEGMFILANPALKKWFPSNDDIHQSDFVIKGDYNFEFKNGDFIEIT
jgi:catechol 2,3-dioxygenase-like lactoylglutathione lyase family enzyme